MYLLFFLAIFAVVDAFKGSGVQIMNDKSVLLVQNLKSGNWGFPKGHREPIDKTWRDTAVREVEEETGLKENIDYVICSAAPDLWGKRPYWTATALRTGPLRVNVSEHRAVRWMVVQSLKHYDLNYDLSYWYLQGAPVKCSSQSIVLTSPPQAWN
jgi:8-oxo-dGTP pyrophosphatase MutT (NUDIX family)